VVIELSVAPVTFRGGQPLNLNVRAMASRFELKIEEVTWGWHGSRTGARKKLSRASAAVDSSSWRLYLKHLPTEVEVHGEIPMGHYSNRQMQSEKEKLWNALQEQLRVAVAKHLRHPGR